MRTLADDLERQRCEADPGGGGTQHRLRLIDDPGALTRGGLGVPRLCRRVGRRVPREIRKHACPRAKGVRLKQGVVMLVTLVMLLAFPPDAYASCIEHPLSGIGTHLARIGRPAPLLLLAGAVAAPFVIAPTGIDQHARVFAQRDLGGHYDEERMSVTAPYALAGALAVGYLAGLAAWDCTSTALTARALQAMGLAFAVMGVTKYAFGRTYPAVNPYAADRLVDDGRSTRASPFTGVAGAWPSGHAATTFAFAAVLRTALPARLGSLRYGGYVLATAVSAGMWLGDHHWLSDLVSGALLGEAVGRSVGAPSLEPAPKVMLVPAGAGVALVGAF